jgi:DNA-formamidopyrimidine glycosylase
MPEGHTLHRHARDHHRLFAGHRVALSSPQGRFSEGARLLDQCTFAEAQAVGKHLLYRFDEGSWIHIHLGLFGKFRVWRKETEPRDSVRLRVAVPGVALDLTGPTACEVWADEQVDALRARLGPDPLDPEADRERFRANLRRRRRPIGAVLLDQAVVAGVGNVYRAELLFLARLDPGRPANSLDDTVVDQLWDDMVRLFPLGVKTNRIITTDPEDFGKPATRLRKDERLWVYKQGSCRVCGGPIAKDEVGNRTLYWCPDCQTR